MMTKTIRARGDGVLMWLIDAEGDLYKPFDAITQEEWNKYHWIEATTLSDKKDMYLRGGERKTDNVIRVM